MKNILILILILTIHGYLRPAHSEEHTFGAPENPLQQPPQIWHKLTPEEETKRRREESDVFNRLLVERQNQLTGELHRSLPFFAAPPKDAIDELNQFSDRLINSKEKSKKKKSCRQNTKAENLLECIINGCKNTDGEMAIKEALAKEIKVEVISNINRIVELKKRILKLKNQIATGEKDLEHLNRALVNIHPVDTGNKDYADMHSSTVAQIELAKQTIRPLEDVLLKILCEGSPRGYFFTEEAIKARIVSEETAWEMLDKLLETNKEKSTVPNLELMK